MESTVRDKIVQIENRATRMINDLRTNENKSTALIRDEERLLLKMIGKNPHKWTSKTLEFNITSSETKTSPTVDVEILRSSIYDELLRSELKFKDQINPKGWKTVGHVNCYSDFELSFDFKRNMNGYNCFFEIGQWFGLLFSKDGTDCCLRLYDLYNDNKYHEITSESFDVHQWYKELSTLFLITEIVKNTECLLLTSSSL